MRRSFQHPLSNMAEDKTDAQPAAPTGTVLCIEDQPISMALIEAMFAPFPGVRLLEAFNGRDGVRLALQEQPDLVLLDMHLPDINGLELLRHLKADADTAAIPVVVVSADATLTQIEGALAAGAARYLTKPVNVAELLAAVDEVLERTITRFG